MLDNNVKSLKNPQVSSVYQEAFQALVLPVRVWSKWTTLPDIIRTVSLPASGIGRESKASPAEDAFIRSGCFQMNFIVCIATGKSAFQCLKRYILHCFALRSSEKTQYYTLSFIFREGCAHDSLASMPSDVF